jgi:hypothetical protein
VDRHRVVAVPSGGPGQPRGRCPRADLTARTVGVGPPPAPQHDRTPAAVRLPSPEAFVP